MRFLIDILHPAHVHFFRNFIADAMGEGHEVKITARDKECVTDLLERYGLEYQLISTQQRGALGLASEMVQRSWALFGIAREFEPDFMTGIMGPSIAVVGKALSSRTVVFYDTEMAKITNWFAYPLADFVCTPSCYDAKVRGRHVTYDGYHELAYLHPSRFEPDTALPGRLGVPEGSSYFVVRFVSWEASHDVGERGFSLEGKRSLVEGLEQHGKVFISSESTLPDDLQARVPDIHPTEMHSLLAQAKMLVGESATMASECAVLGVPSVYVARTSRGYIDDEARRYDLVHIFDDRQEQPALERALALAADPGLGERSAEARSRLLEERIDVTAWMHRFFAAPESFDN
ncbi:MAG TPA: hypothetical protein DIU15_20020 [Deltaproteobacteria bacterium]|nr:hypothetical protein [Deltaproteobacteria bacterium]HCP48337.1 hypothetical protein [Deltaproteobacteria bacterium]|tara:strand:- start:324 stop:1364 length:1041 start_codon:yes stop_codon:yes gene_type:complete